MLEPPPETPWNHSLKVYCCSGSEALPNNSTPRLSRPWKALFISLSIISALAPAINSIESGFSLFSESQAIGEVTARPPSVGASIISGLMGTASFAVNAFMAYDYIPKIRKDVTATMRSIWYSPCSLKNVMQFLSIFLVLGCSAANGYIAFDTFSSMSFNWLALWLGITNALLASLNTFATRFVSTKEFIDNRVCLYRPCERESISQLIKLHELTSKADLSTLETERTEPTNLEVMQRVVGAGFPKQELLNTFVSQHPAEWKKITEPQTWRSYLPNRFELCNLIVAIPPTTLALLTFSEKLLIMANKLADITRNPGWLIFCIFLCSPHAMTYLRTGTLFIEKTRESFKARPGRTVSLILVNIFAAFNMFNVMLRLANNTKTPPLISFPTGGLIKFLCPGIVGLGSFYINILSCFRILTLPKQNELAQAVEKIKLRTFEHATQHISIRGPLDYHLLSSKNESIEMKSHLSGDYVPPSERQMTPAEGSPKNQPLYLPLSSTQPLASEVREKHDADVLTPPPLNHAIIKNDSDLISQGSIQITPPAEEQDTQVIALGGTTSYTPSSPRFYAAITHRRNRSSTPGSTPQLTPVSPTQDNNKSSTSSPLVWLRSISV